MIAPRKATLSTHAAVDRDLGVHCLVKQTTAKLLPKMDAEKKSKMDVEMIHKWPQFCIQK